MDMFESLLTSSSGKRVSPEMLEMLGRKASALYQEKGVSLNQAVRQVAAQHPELGNEHVKRIVEFANTVTFQEMFSKNPDKNIHFEVGDPGVVLRDLKDGGSPAHDGKTLQGGLGDYHTAPAKEHDAGDQQELEQLFATRSQSGDHTAEPQDTVKTAAAAPGPGMHANPYEDVYDAHQRLQASRNELAGAHEQFDLLLKAAHADLLRIVKDESLSSDGAGLGGVLGVLEKLASKELVFSVLGPAIEKLAQDPQARVKLEAGLTKRAGRVVNLNHPLVAAWSGLVKAAEDKLRTSEALKEIDEHLTETDAFLKSAGRPVTNKVRGMIGRIAATRQRFPRKA